MSEIRLRRDGGVNEVPSFHFQRIAAAIIFRFGVIHHIQRDKCRVGNERVGVQHRDGESAPEYRHTCRITAPHRIERRMETRPNAPTRVRDSCNTRRALKIYAQDYAACVPPQSAEQVQAEIDRIRNAKLEIQIQTCESDTCQR